MTKITKDFTDALGFRLLSSYHSFAAEYPVEGAKIQKIYDDGFKDTCYKCYPIIAEAGVDPTVYEPKAQAAGLKSELRKMFPIKKVEEPKHIPKVLAPKLSPESPVLLHPETIDLDEETALSDLTQADPTPKVTPPKLKCPNCQRMQEELLEAQANAEKHIAFTTASLKDTTDMMQAKLDNLSKIIADKNKALMVYEKTIESFTIQGQKDVKTIAHLTAENKALIAMLRQYQTTLQGLDKQIDREVKKRRQ
jgi:hypothetical protein